MGKELESYTDGTYVFQETEEEGKFLFYRQDGAVLNNVNFEPMDMYQCYLFMKMANGEINGAVCGNMETKISKDRKCMLLITTANVREMKDIEVSLESEKSKPECSFKRKVKSIFGLNKK